MPHPADTTVREDDQSGRSRLAELYADVERRLARVCAHLSPEDFDALVLDIAHVKLKYEQRRALGSAVD